MESNRAFENLSDYDLNRCRTHIEKSFERLETVENVLGERGGADRWLSESMARLGDVHQLIVNEQRIRSQDE